MQVPTHRPRFYWPSTPSSPASTISLHDALPGSNYPSESHRGPYRLVTLSDGVAVCTKRSSTPGDFTGESESPSIHTGHRSLL